MRAGLTNIRENRPRTPDHNARFHRMCRDVANQMQWAGRTWDEEDWKRLFLGAKFGQPVVPSPFGHNVCVMNAKRSRELSNGEMEDLIGEVQAFGDEHGIKWSEHEPK